MRFSINKKEIAEKLQSLISIIPTKSNMMILSNFKIEADAASSQLTITATDLNITTIVKIAANVLETGSVLVSAKLSEILNALPDSEVKFSIKEDNLFVECEKSEYEIRYVESSLFPEIPTIQDAQEYTIDSDNFKKLIHNTIFCASTDTMQSVCNGVFLRIEEGLVTMAATDTKRIGEAKLTTPISCGEPYDIVIPTRALTFLDKAINADTEELKIKYDEHRIIFTLPNITLISNRFEGRYPNYTVAFRHPPVHEFMIDKNKLRDAIRRVSLLSEDEDKLIKVYLYANELRIESVHSDRGTAKESVSPYKYEGPEDLFCINSKFILSILSVIETEEVIFKYISNEQAFWMLNNCTFENIEIRFLVMPMRLDRNRYYT